jgi:type IV pilus assembly protein PilV
MRVNKLVAQAGGYDIALATPSPVSASVVDTDRVAWKAAIAASLPDGDGAIVTATGVTTITIQWDDSRGTGGSNTQRFSMSTEL